MSAPVFVVVGHVNRGKSSIVATLAADESVRIGEQPGTTRHCRSYPMRLGDEVLYTLVDTPGFERARHVLAWLRERATSTAERPAAVRAFVREHAGSGRFEQECELLQPILDGGSILYVVDGSLPFSPASEAETEILRWTGQPRMALINPIGAVDHGDAWRPILDQYFSLVRTFDAHQADFRGRSELLRALRELDEAGRADLDRAIEALERDRAHALETSAGLIADAITDLVTHTEEERLPPEGDPEPHRGKLEQRYYDALRERELALRTALRRVYLHRDLKVEQATADHVEEDLFDTGTWSRLGLSRPQLLASGAAAGALVGGGVDAATGGASFLLGTVLGGAAGLASTWLAWDRLVEVRVLGQTLGGTLLRIGPMTNVSFPWVVLDRALLFHRTVSQRSHARRAAVSLLAEGGVVADLDAELRKPVESALKRLRGHGDGSERSAARTELAAAVARILAEAEP